MAEPTDREAEIAALKKQGDATEKHADNNEKSIDQLRVRHGLKIAVLEDAVAVLTKAFTAIKEMLAKLLGR